MLGWLCVCLWVGVCAAAPHSASNPLQRKDETGEPGTSGTILLDSRLPKLGGQFHEWKKLALYYQC